MPLRFIHDLIQRRELLQLLAERTLKIRYRGSVLGFFWSLLTPVLLIGIYGFFATILRFHEAHDHYLAFLIVGIVIWQFLSLCVGDSLGAILGHANLIKKTRFPRIVLPVSMVLANLLNFLLTLVVVGVFLFWDNSHCQGLYWLPVAIVLQTTLCLGMSLIFSCLNLLYRDTEHVVGIFLLGWFFLTPVFYPLLRQLELLQAQGVPDWLVFLNPMTGIVTLYRHVLISDPLCVPASYFAVSLVVCIVSLVVGLFVFKQLEPRMADEL